MESTGEETKVGQRGASGFARYSPDDVERIRERIGTPITKTFPRPFVTKATADAIYHWALGIGDYNKLYLDRAYASKLPWKTLLVPPSMLYAFDKRVTGGVMGLRGIHGMFSGVRWEWSRRLLEDEELSISEATVHEVTAHDGAFAGQTLKITSKIVIVDREGKTVAVSYPYSFRMERDEGRRRQKYARAENQKYSQAEIDAIWDLMETEAPRGLAPIKRADIEPGASIGRIARGPITLSDLIMFEIGWGGQYIRSHGDWVRWIRRKPTGGIRNKFGVPDCPEAVHWDYDIAAEVGAPGPYDYGPQRVAWATTLVTNWMGDLGELRSIELQLRRLVVVGDAVWISGTVREARTEANGNVNVTVDIVFENQRAETITKGSASVILQAEQFERGAGEQR